MNIGQSALEDGMAEFCNQNSRALANFVDRLLQMMKELVIFLLCLNLLLNNIRKNAILDGCSTVGCMLDCDGIQWFGWYCMVFNSIQWYSIVLHGI